MALLGVLVLLVLSLSHWLLEPFVRSLLPVFSLSWLGWLILALLLWLLAGGATREPPSDPKG